MSKQPMHILLIEDNPGDADLVRLRLVEGNSNLDVACADRLSAGLNSIEHDAPAVVLLDLNLPDSSGAATFRNVLKNAPGVPVVVLSGQDDEDLAVKAVHQGVQDYLVKGDFDSKQLSRAIRYAMERQALITSLDMSRKQQLQFKDQFLSHVSHELRTPLTCIHQFISLLLDELAGPISSEQREHLETAMRSVNQLRSMIGDLLEATRAETGKLRIQPKCFSVSEVVQQSVAMLQTSAQNKHVQLQAAVDEKLPLVHADSERVLQVLTNLIENSIKFTPGDGSIVVKTYSVPADPGYVYLSVTDTGRGINSETKALVFERLYQDPEAQDNSRKGLGLGLYIVQELVRMQGGRIWVESQIGHGSTFTFTLPVFSLSKLLAPILADQGRVRESISLIQIELAARSGSDADRGGLRERCLEALRESIVPSRDIVLPEMGTVGEDMRLLLVTASGLNAANALCQKMQQQLERTPDINASAVFKISAMAIQLPPFEGQSVEKRMQEAADGISTAAMGMIRTERLHTSAANSHLSGLN